MKQISIFSLIFFTSNLIFSQNILWEGVHGDALIGGTSYDQGFAVTQLANGKVIGAGYRQSQPSNGSSDIFTVNVNSADGLQAVEMNYGGINSDIAHGIVKTNDGYAICGERDGAAYIIKLDNNGLMQWQYFATGTIVYDIVETADGGFAATGYKNDATNKNVYILKVSSSGILVFENSLIVTGEEIGQGIVETPNGEFVVVGSKNPSTAVDAYAVRFSSTGTVVWEKTYDGSGTQDYAFDIIKVAGATEAYAFTGKLNNQFYIIKIDGAGTTIFNTVYNQPGFILSTAYSISQKNNGSFILAGECTNNTIDGLILEASATGVYKKSFTIGTVDYNNTIEGAYLIDDNNLLVIGKEDDWQGYPDMYLAKIDVTNTADLFSNQLLANISMYPNPVKDILTVQTEENITSIKVMNLEGKSVLNSTSKEINVSSLVNGMYILEVENTSGVISTAKFIKD